MANPEEQYSAEIDAVVAKIEENHQAVLKPIQDENDRLKAEAKTAQDRIDEAESKGWAAAIGAMKRRLFGS